MLFDRLFGYNTGEFGKNHLGDNPEALPTAHGFQEYWGYLYHLDAMQAVSFPRASKRRDSSYREWDFGLRTGAAPREA